MAERLFSPSKVSMTLRFVWGMTRGLVCWRERPGTMRSPWGVAAAVQSTWLSLPALMAEIYPRLVYGGMSAIGCIEPFVGGCAGHRALATTRPDRRLLPKDLLDVLAVFFFIGELGALGWVQFLEFRAQRGQA